MRYLLITLCFLFRFSSQSNAQLLTIVEGDSLQIACDSQCIMLHNAYAKTIKTDVYSVGTIPYNPTALSGATTLALSDDSFSTNIPLGFSFCFFNSAYSNVYISRNGVVTFDAAYANGACSFNTTQSIPYSSNTFADKAIFCPFMDLGTNATGTVKFKTIGTAPYRQFVLQYNNLPLFGAACSLAINKFELVLHETYNFIDLQITKKDVCNTSLIDPINFSTLGIQNLGAFVVANSRNATIWTAINEGWRFSPAGANNFSISYTVTNGASIVQSNNDSIKLCATNYPYTVKVQYQSLCPAFTIVDSIKIKKYTPSIDSLAITKPTCEYSTNGSIKVYATTINNPLQYKVGNAPWTTNQTTSGLANGVYTINVKDANNCVASNSVLLSPISKVEIVVDSTTEASCLLADGKIYLSAKFGFPTYTWLWPNGSTLPYILNVFGDSSISVTVTDSLGCVDSMYVKTNKKGPTIVLDSLIKSGCTDSSGKIYVHVIDSTGVAPFSFLWSTGDTTNVATHCTGGVNYSVVVTDALGCTKRKNFQMEFDSLPTVQITQIAKPTCDKSNGKYLAVGSGGVQPYSFLWNNGITTALNTTADSGLIYVTLTDATGCVVNVLANIIDTLEMNVQGGALATKCNYNNGVAYVNLFNGMAPYTYAWSNGANTSVADSLAAGTYTVTVSDALACISTLTYIVAPSVPIAVQVVSKNANCDSTNGFINTTYTNATGIIQYTWSNGDTTKNIKYIGAGVYTLSAVDAIGCATSTTVTLTDEGKPFASITDFQRPLCYGDSTGILTLLATGGLAPYKYSLDGINYITSPVLTNVAAGNYTMYVKDANSCINDTVIVLYDVQKIIVNFASPDTLICYTDKVDSIRFITSGGFPPYAYNLDNLGNSNNNLFSNIGIGAHQLLIRDSIGCSPIFPFTVYGPAENLSADVQRKDIPCFETNTGYLRATIVGGWPPYTWQWNNGKTSLLIDSLVAGKYILNIKDVKGCDVNVPFELLQNNCCEALMPNAFSPNGDGINEVLKIISRAELSELQLMIYDRWGAKVFSTSDPNQAWDGRLQGKDLPMDTYFYSARYKCSFDENYFYLKGDVILVK
jgi:gliding motility-associated-like protein